MTYTCTQWGAHVHTDIHLHTSPYTCGSTYRRTPVQTKVHVHIIIDTHLHILTYTCTHLHTPVHTDVHISPWICSCKQWHTLLHTDVCLYWDTYVHSQVQLCTLTYTCTFWCTPYTTTNTSIHWWTPVHSGVRLYTLIYTCVNELIVICSAHNKIKTLIQEYGYLQLRVWGEKNIHFLIVTQEKTHTRTHARTRAPDIYTETEGQLSRSVIPIMEMRIKSEVYFYWSLITVHIKDKRYDSNAGTDRSECLMSRLHIRVQVNK